MAAHRYDEYQGSNLVARGRRLSNVLHEINAGNEGIYIRDQGSVRYVGQMIGSPVLRTAWYKYLWEKVYHRNP